MTNIDKIKNSLQELTSLENITLTESCNAAINIAYKIARSAGFNKCFILDPFKGGWSEHLFAAKKHNFNVTMIETLNLSFDLAQLHELDSRSIFMIPSVSEYCYLHPVEKIYEICKARGALFINDCCGSVTQKQYLLGDILVCSFGKLKPVNNHKGGFISIKNHSLRNKIGVEEYVSFDLVQLYTNIIHARARVDALNQDSLAMMKILDKNNIHYVNNTDNINMLVMAEYSSIKERQRIVEITERGKEVFYSHPNKPSGLITLTTESMENMVDAGVKFKDNGQRIYTDQQKKWLIKQDPALEASLHD